MGKILVTGASGSLGIWVLKYLLSENKYEITAIDIKSKETIKKLKPYHKRLNIIYGDVEDYALIDSLVKEHDIIIHLAGIMPPLCNLNRNFGEQIDLLGTENIARSISFYNPDCFLIYPSTTYLYENSSKEISSTSPINYNQDDYFSGIKEQCENIIKKKLKNYIIFRMPFLMEDSLNQHLYLFQKNTEIELLSTRDAAYAIVSSLKYLTELNKKTKIISGGEGCRINSTSLLIKLLEIYGYRKNILWNTFFNTFQYSGNIYKPDKKLIKMLNYQNDTISSFLETLKNQYHNNFFSKFLAKIYIKKLERKMKS